MNAEKGKTFFGGGFLPRLIRFCFSPCSPCSPWLIQKPFIRALALIALAVSTPASAALFGGAAGDIAAEVRAAGREGRRVAVLFELPDCPECLKMKRAVFSDPGVEKAFGSRYRTVRVDLGSAAPLVDADGQRRAPEEIAGRWRVFAAPSFVFLDAAGQPEYLHTGSLTRPADFISLGRFVAEAIYEERPFSDYLLEQ